jgi:phytoene/squalene synthetase
MKGVLMQSAAEFYQQHLDRVSRSFAFCIRQLPFPLREWIGLSYLLCRLADTIEDAPWPNPEDQARAFAAFDAALMSVDAAELLAELAPLFPEIRQAERELVLDSPRLLRDYHALPAAVHGVFRDLVHSMSLGMQHFSARRPLRLRTLGEVNQYCLFVAGLVGELLVHLVASVEPRLQITQTSLLKAHHFGLFLQKVNLLKDQVEDEREGRHLVPSRDLIESSARENAESAMDFLITVPKEQIEFRRFCAWSLFLGLESLFVARRSVDEKKVVKVTREQTESLLGEVESRLTNDLELRGLFKSFGERLGWVGPTTAWPLSLDAPAWILDTYRGLLDAKGLRELRVMP